MAMMICSSVYIELLGPSNTCLATNVAYDCLLSNLIVLKKAE